MDPEIGSSWISTLPYWPDEYITVVSVSESQDAIYYTYEWEKIQGQDTETLKSLWSQGEGVYYSNKHTLFKTLRHYWNTRVESGTLVLLK